MLQQGTLLLLLLCKSSLVHPSCHEGCRRKNKLYGSSFRAMGTDKGATALQRTRQVRDSAQLSPQSKILKTPSSQRDTRRPNHCPGLVASSQELSSREKSCQAPEVSPSPRQIQQATCKTSKSPAPQRRGCLSSKVPHWRTGLLGTAQCPPGTGVTLSSSSSPSPHSPKQQQSPQRPPSLLRSKPSPKSSLCHVRCFEKPSRDGGTWPGAPRGSPHHWNWGAAWGAQFIQTHPQEALSPPPGPTDASPGWGNSCWLWEAVDLFKLEGKQGQGSLGRRGGSGAGGSRGGWCVPWPGCG